MTPSAKLVHKSQSPDVNDKDKSRPQPAELKISVGVLGKVSNSEPAPFSKSIMNRYSPQNANKKMDVIQEGSENEQDK